MSLPFKKECADILSCIADDSDCLSESQLITAERLLPVLHLMWLIYEYPVRAAVGRVADALLGRLGDRWRLVLQKMCAVPFEQSFCQFAERDQAFRTDDSARDPRLVGNPYRGVVVSYHSVPTLNQDRILWGTLTHFDMSSLLLSDTEFELLEQAAGVLSRYAPHMAE